MAVFVWKVTYNDGCYQPLAYVTDDDGNVVISERVLGVCAATLTSAIVQVSEAIKIMRSTGAMSRTSDGFDVDLPLVAVNDWRQIELDVSPEDIRDQWEAGMEQVWHYWE